MPDGSWMLDPVISTPPETSLVLQRCASWVGCDTVLWVDETDGLLLEAAVLDVEGRLLEVLVLTADEGLEDDAPPEDDVPPVLPPLGFGSSVLPISPEVPVDTVASDVVLSDEVLGGRGS